MNLAVNQIYDTVTDSWSFGAPIPTAVKSAACATSDSPASKIYLIGGELATNGSSTNIVQIYNPAKDSWSVGASMPTARFGLAVAVINDAIYAMGGTDHYIWPTEQANAENEMYTPTNELPQSSPTPMATPTPSGQSNSEPFPTSLVIASVVTLAVVGVGLLVYFKKRRHGLVAV